MHLQHHVVIALPDIRYIEVVVSPAVFVQHILSSGVLEISCHESKSNTSLCLKTARIDQSLISAHTAGGDKKYAPHLSNSCSVDGNHVKRRACLLSGRLPVWIPTKAKSWGPEPARALMPFCVTRIFSSRQSLLAFFHSNAGKTADKVNTKVPTISP